MLIHRRDLLIGLGSMLAAPAIVHAQNIMPGHLMLPGYDWDSFNGHPEGLMYQWNDRHNIYGDVQGILGNWRPVPASLYRNKFQIGRGDTIEYGGCVLMQKPREPVQSVAYPWPEIFKEPGSPGTFGSARIIPTDTPEEIARFKAMYDKSIAKTFAEWPKVKS